MLHPPPGKVWESRCWLQAAACINAARAHAGEELANSPLAHSGRSQPSLGPGAAMVSPCHWDAGSAAPGDCRRSSKRAVSPSRCQPSEDGFKNPVFLFPVLLELGCPPDLFAKRFDDLVYVLVRHIVGVVHPFG